MIIKNKLFVKSTFSGAASCVGVAKEDNNIFVINTKEGKAILKFTKNEWIAFVKGVKNEEFDFFEIDE